MASFRVGALLLSAWGFDLLLLSLFPRLRLLIDPLLLFLIFQGSRLSSKRFLWLQGIGVGLLRDLSSGGVFGLWACTFAWVGWAMNAVQRLVEWDDPLIVAVLAGGLTLAAGIGYPLLLLVADPAGAGVGFPWLPVLATAWVHTGAAYGGFQPLRQFVRRPASVFRL